ncbi:hypothetical protein JHK87_012370 [Glycine soja]|nr:hypothetical protein JHK87_012370 [Glycine soja]
MSPQTNMRLFSVLCPHSQNLQETSQRVTYPIIAPSQACLTVEFLSDSLIPTQFLDLSHFSIIDRGCYTHPLT